MVADHLLNPEQAVLKLLGFGETSGGGKHGAGHRASLLQVEDDRASAEMVNKKSTAASSRRQNQLG